MAVCVVFLFGAAKSLAQSDSRGSRFNLPASQIYRDVAYADKSQSQRLDIYLPEKGIAPYPVIIAVHGGAFLGGQKEHPGMPIAKGLENGYAVVSVEYRLLPEAKFPAAVNDVKAAVRFIRKNSDEYKLNADKMAAWGESAGGSLVSTLGTTGGTNDLYDMSLGYEDVSDKVVAVVDWYGPINFLTMDVQFDASLINPAFAATNSSDSPASKYLGAQITKVPELVAQANPASYIDANDPAFFIQHGTADAIIPILQSIDFYHRSC